MLSGVGEAVLSRTELLKESSHCARRTSFEDCTGTCAQDEWAKGPRYSGAHPEQVRDELLRASRHLDLFRKLEFSRHASPQQAAAPSVWVAWRPSVGAVAVTFECHFHSRLLWGSCEEQHSQPAASWRSSTSLSAEASKGFRGEAPALVKMLTLACRGGLRVKFTQR